LKNLEKSDDGADEIVNDRSTEPPRTGPGSDRHQQVAVGTPSGTVPGESVPISQRLQMFEQALAGLAMGLQSAASRQGVENAIKEVRDEIETLGSRLKAFEGIVTETLTLTTRLDGLDRATGEVQVEIRRLPTRADISQVLDQSNRVQGAQTAINDELGRLGGILGRMLKLQRWQLLGLVFIGIGVICAGVALLVPALLTGPR
jgi:hypothetical protein